MHFILFPLVRLTAHLALPVLAGVGVVSLVRKDAPKPAAKSDGEVK